LSQLFQVCGLKKSADVAFACARSGEDAEWSVLKILAMTALLLLIAGPAMPQAPARRSIAPNPATSVGLPVDINHASLEQLLQVPGMTRPWAERIVRFRPYRSKLDLLQDGVLPGDVYNRIKVSIVAHRDQK
jgi:DNA uptake protein ComE-like DNA-binding protein